jgi:hypothetical protein
MLEIECYLYTKLSQDEMDRIEFYIIHGKAAFVFPCFLNLRVKIEKIFVFYMLSKAFE